MIRSLWTILLSLLFATSLLAAPAPTGYTGTLTNGSEVSFTGTGFGTKSVAAPKYWHGFESETPNAYVGATGLNLAQCGSGLHGEVINTLHHNGGQAYLLDFTNTGSDLYRRDVFDIGEGGADEVYVTFWMYLTETGSTQTSGQWKGPNIGTSTEAYTTGDNAYRTINNTNWRYSNTDTWFNTHTVMYYNGTANMGHTGSSCPTSGLTKTTWPIGSWYRWTIYVKSSSSAGVNDAQIYETKLDGSNAEVFITGPCTDWTSHDASSTTKYRYVSLSSGVENVSGSWNLKLYLDDVYIDNTQARVEIGDASTWTACKHREIQPATAWTDNADPTSDSITVTLNQGSFADGSTAYVYVVDSTGAVNANGYEITFGDTEDPAPAPPTLSNVTISGGSFR